MADTATDSSPLVRDETTAEYFSDAVLCLAFTVIGVIAWKRREWSQEHGGAETNVVTAFYSLILMTSFFRAIWFAIPNSLLKPSYVPHAVMAFDKNHPSWVGGFFSEELLTAGSLSLFSIFILILVYWADILKKYFQPGSGRVKPMTTFKNIVGALLVIEFINAALFLTGKYSSEGMILLNALLLANVSIICVIEITIFSHKFRTVLQTLGAINQVSTESQVKRIVWITVTGNLFFFTRALIETIFAAMLIIYWYNHGTVQEVFSHPLWDTYMSLKHWSEVIILALMLYILQSRFTTSEDASKIAGVGYEAVPDEDDSDPKVQGNLVV
jgi:hypothetical protein